ncbi:hypothetical protein BZG36_01105 [Bifiguratus adelaidae]|uniref:Uncharacterized protein n=1 Tax=Bifiguratus adelaidae TaxID=1938954 RepID=A0A261Y5Z9_9FUNG|nr:hypothetical protein BZG36_01105 [Bifiguratus adelaidae]
MYQQELGFITRADVATITGWATDFQATSAVGVESAGVGHYGGTAGSGSFGLLQTIGNDSLGGLEETSHGELDSVQRHEPNEVPDPSNTSQRPATSLNVSETPVGVDRMKVATSCAIMKAAIK